MEKKYPKSHYANYKVAQAIFRHGAPVTLEEGISLHGYTGLPRRYAMQAIYTDMVKAGYLIKHGDKYELAEYLRKHYCDLNHEPYAPKADVVKQRYHKPFTPMKVWPKDERIRDISFITVTG